MTAHTDTAAQAVDPVTLWGQVIEGFQVTNKNLHRTIARAYDLDAAEAEALLRLIRSPQRRMSMAELARQVAFSTGGFTKVADRLTKRGLVQRAPCPEDRRVVYLELTAEGRTTAGKVRDLVAETMTATFVDVLGPERAVVVAQAMADLHRSGLDRA
ncbi:MarR family winged helix-turn-helix transcriptional regulator [Kocuria marina]|uniref:MarR family winged helix-turn-helix transcriptional regulator n=1 Tax=Kocuria marina TaxID=223184 RepID=UPI00068E4E4F|nr:MarR family transcriptional regulator [Kocuria marina]